MMAAAFTIAFTVWSTQTMNVPPGDWGGLGAFLFLNLTVGAFCWGAGMGINAAVIWLGHWIDRTTGFS